MTNDKNVIWNAVTGRIKFSSGDGKNSVIQKKSNATVFGKSATALGTSSTNAEDLGITKDTPNEDILNTWLNSGDDKFALAKGDASYVEGHNCIALGKNSHAEGNGTAALNNSSHAEGTGSISSGKYAHAEGLETVAEGTGSHTEGKECKSEGEYSDYSHAEGEKTITEVRTGHAEGYSSIAARSGYTENTLTPKSQGGASSGWLNGCSHAEGNATIAQGLGAHAEGEKTFANGRTAHAEGLETVASGPYSSHAEGEATIASGEDSHVEGWLSESTGRFTHAEGCDTTASGDNSHAEGIGSKSDSTGAHAEGIHGYKVRLKRTSSKTFTNQSAGVTVNVGDIDVLSNSRVTEVNGTTVKFGKDIFGSGTQNRVLTFGDNSLNTQSGAFNRGAHAEGECTVAKGEASHAEGYFTTVEVATESRTITGAHAEGYETFAGEWAAHAEGYNCQVNGSASSNDLDPDTDGYAGQMAHAEGNATLAAGNASHAEGVKTFTQNMGEHAEGMYNRSNLENTIHSVGIGDADNNRKNAFEVFTNGLVFIYGVAGYDGTNANGNDYSNGGNSVQAIMADAGGFNVDGSLFGWD